MENALEDKLQIQKKNCLIMEVGCGATEIIVLTKGKNVLKGDHLVYNMETGKSVVTGADKADLPWEKPARVHALFIPDDKSNKPDDKSNKK